MHGTVPLQSVLQNLLCMPSVICRLPAHVPHPVCPDIRILDLSFLCTSPLRVDISFFICKGGAKSGFQVSLYARGLRLRGRGDQEPVDVATGPDSTGW